MSSKAKAEVKASLVPAKSQVLLVAFVVGFVFTLLCGTYLLGDSKQEGWGLIALAGTIFLGTLWAWSRAQSDSDLDNSHPTSFRMPDGTSITTDTRTLRSLDSTLNLGLLLQELLHRKPLPLPTALVDETLRPLPDTQDEARAIVDNINLHTQAVSNYILDSLGLTDETASNLQKLSTDSPTNADLQTPQSLNQPTEQDTSN